MKIATTMIIMEQTSDEEEIEQDIYGEESRDELVDSDELTPEEAGFMKGYLEA